MLLNILQFLMSRGAGASTANESDPPAAEADADGSAGAQESAPQTSPLGGLLQQFFNRSGNQKQQQQSVQQQPGRGGFPPQMYGQRTNSGPSSKKGRGQPNVSQRGNGMLQPIYPPQGQYPAPYGYGTMMPPAQAPQRYGNRMNANVNRQNPRGTQQSPMIPYGGFGGSGRVPGIYGGMGGYSGQPGPGVPFLQSPNSPRGLGQPPYPQNRQQRNQRRGTPPYNPRPF